jgi:hypothetical protein
VGVGDGDGAAEPLAAASRPSPALALAGLAVLVGAALSVLDYSRVAAIFSASPDAPSLEQRIATGQRSVLFAHHADYAAVTAGRPGLAAAHGFSRTVHYLLDARLMIAWSRALAERGDLDAARHLALRLREFRNAEATDFFAPCPQAAVPLAAPGLPFQCQLPSRTLDWREFLSK